MTAVLHDLRQSLTLTREVYGRGSSQSQAAFELLVRTAAQNGTPLDALRNYVEDEVERFFRYTIAGPDGHVYWDGPAGFRRNDGKTRRPARWWWEHGRDVLANTDDVIRTCGEAHCINPEHAYKAIGRRSRMQWTEDRIIGALQVVAMRLGHTPSMTEWDRLNYRPVHEIIARRFGGWAKAIAAAGLPPVVRHTTQGSSRAQVIAGIRLVRGLLGRWPSHQDYISFKAELAKEGLPSTPRPATRLYGSFAEARVAAGGPESLRSDGQSRRTDPRGGVPASKEDCIRGILFVRERIGRWPSKSEYMGERDALLAAGLPASETPMRRLFGSFTAARVAAGGLASVREEEHLRPPHVSRTAPEDVLEAVRFVRGRIGRWPTRREYVAEAAALKDAGFPVSEGPAIKMFGSFAAARAAAGGPAQLPGGQAARKLARTRQPRKERDPET